MSFNLMLKFYRCAISPPKLLFFLSIIFWQLITTTNQATAQDSSSLIRQYKAATNATQQAMASQKLGRFLYDSGRYERGIYWAALALPAAKKTNIDSILWKHYDLLADLHDNALHYDSSIAYMLQSLALKKKNNRLNLVAGTYNDLGVVYGEKTELVKQAECYYEAKKIYDKTGSLQQALKVATNLASNSYRQGKYQQAINEYHTLLPQLKTQPNKELLYFSYVRMTICFAELQQQDSTFYYADLEKRAAAILGNKQYSFDSWSRNAYFCGEFENFKNYRQAIDSLMYYARLLKNEVNWGDYYASIGVYQMKFLKQYDSAIANFYRSFDAAYANSDKASAQGTLLNIAKAYQLKNDPANAYKTLLRANALKDSIINEDGRNKLAELQTQYETEKKEAQILLLNEENKLKARTTYFLIAGLLLLAVVLLSLFRNNRLKQKVNKKLQQLNTALDGANQSKARLFSILSHDLRSPVSSLYSYLQLKKIAPQRLTEAMRQEKEVQLLKSAGNLLETMEDILIWSKSQLDNFVPNKVEVAILPLLQNISGMYQPELLAKNLELSLPARDVKIVTDEYILLTILRNLISNAIKSTEENGSIKIDFEHNGIQIFNTGKPIDVTKLQAAVNWTALNSSQSGYGLKLCFELADKIGIKIEAVPREDGTVFMLSF